MLKIKPVFKNNEHRFFNEHLLNIEILFLYL